MKNKLVDIKNIINHFDLEAINQGQENLIITAPDLNILGLELVGAKKGIESSLTLVGPNELNYLDSLNKEGKLEGFTNLLAQGPKAIIFTDSLEIPSYLKNIFLKYDLWVLKASLPLSALYSRLYEYLKEKLGNRLAVHGTFLSIHGMGVLLEGDSGIGKSETALDLIKRGHELISDDLVELYEGSSGYLIGEAPDLLKKKLEIRGIGIVDVVNMFGAASYYPRKRVDLVIELKAYNKNTDYDRLGIDELTVNLLGNKIKKMVIPVLPGRNLALLVESATLKAKLIKYMGVDDSQEFINTLDSRRRNDK